MQLKLHTPANGSGFKASLKINSISRIICAVMAASCAERRDSSANMDPQRFSQDDYALKFVQKYDDQDEVAASFSIILAASSSIDLGVTFFIEKKN